jgi:tetratricopeptide (TPR) repeat protein
VRLWDPVAGKDRAVLAHDGERDKPHRAAISPDGQLLATAAYDHLPLARVPPVVRVWEVATGREVFTFRGHEGAVQSLHFSGRGDRLLSFSADQTGLLWGLTQPPGQPSGAEACWRAMREPTAEGFRAGLELLARPEEAIRLLGRELKAAPRRDRKRIAALVRRLDADTRAERERAYRDLAKLGRAAETELRAAVKTPPTPEAARSARRLLEALTKEAPAGDALRALRAVRVLEQVGTGEARKVLEALGKGEPEAELTRAALAALKRFPERKK